MSSFCFFSFLKNNFLMSCLKVYVLDLPIGQNLNFLSVCVQRAKRPPKLMDLILQESNRKKSKAEGL